MTIPLVSEEPTVVNSTPGRIRIHVPDWEGSSSGQRLIEQKLSAINGVISVQGGSVTQNVLIRFSPGATDPQKILHTLRQIQPELRSGAKSSRAKDAPPPFVREKLEGSRRRARIAVRGLDRSPALARAVVNRLQQNKGITARANPLTGRVLVEYDAHRADIDDLLSQVVDMELPALPGEDRPTNPLDPGPLIQSASRTAAAGAGLALIGIRQGIGIGAASVAPTIPAYISGVFGLIQGIPFLRSATRHIVGRAVADIAFALPDLLSLALSGNLLGLLVTGAGSLRLLTEVTARRNAWKQYEQHIHSASSATAGDTITLEAGERAPLTGQVSEGYGTAITQDGLPHLLSPGQQVFAGSRVLGGPFTVTLDIGKDFTPHVRPAPPRPSLYGRYQRRIGVASLAYAGLVGLWTRSPARLFESLLLVNPRTATIGTEAANTGASAYVLRSGGTLVGTRQERLIRLPNILLLDSPRVMTDGVQLNRVVSLQEECDSADITSLAAGISLACGSPWGPVFPPAGAALAVRGDFDGKTARATIGEVSYLLRLAVEQDGPEVQRFQQRGEIVLALETPQKPAVIGLLTLRPRLSSELAQLRETCRLHGVQLQMMPSGNGPADSALSVRGGVPLAQEPDPLQAIQQAQEQGLRVAYVSDSAQAAEAFEACDLGIGLTSGRSGRFPARADILAPDLAVVAAVIEAGAQREATARDSVVLSAAANIFGIIWGLRGRPGVERASRAVYVTALAAIADGWFRLRGAKKSSSLTIRLADPKPERWGARSTNDVLKALKSSPTGLTSQQASARHHLPLPSVRRNAYLAAIGEQVTSPLIGILGAGAALSLFLGHSLDFLIIGATILINVSVGVWQERQTGRAAETLARLGSVTATVVRDGQSRSLPAPLIVTGDVLLLAAGDRIPADARLLESKGLEVDEASLTGESLPVQKAAEGGTDASRVVLEGSNVTVGTARAVVFAVGKQTRLGVTAAALETDETAQSPLGRRLGSLLGQFLPLAGMAGGILFISGVLRGQPLLPHLALSSTVALAAVPEGLPLLAGMGESAVARRLSKRRALVRRLSAVEALGRVDVACTDKTGTLTEGRLVLTLIAGLNGEQSSTDDIPVTLRPILLAAALASPHVDAPDAASHPTDVAVVQGALRAGLGDNLHIPRLKEEPFDPAHAFYATLVEGALYVKGAPESLAVRCTSILRNGETTAIDADTQHDLLGQAQQLASQGLRVLMAAKSEEEQEPSDPKNLTALGFVCISDPLRPSAALAVHRCQEAGIRVIMITGDHPATARAIAAQAGLPTAPEDILTSGEIAELHNGDLAQRLEKATVIARATPLDKLKIIESLQSKGHTVAMTGDGVNDAPALRLADVGVAMGIGGTEVARQTADVILSDDDFGTLVEALVEGRGFWQNMRRALGLLLGGNLGELGLVVGAGLLGIGTPLNTRQILAMNMITDALPALSIATQPPEHRHLSALAREGTSALDAPLRRDVLRRGASTALPSLAAFILGLPLGLPQAQTLAFSSVVATQLAQTLDAGRTEGRLTPGVVRAVTGSAALLFAALTVAPLRAVLTLAAPTPVGWGIIGASAASAVVLARMIPGGELTPPLSLPVPTKLPVRPRLALIAPG